MKLKRIKEHEIVVDKYEYARLVRLENRLNSAEKAIVFGTNPEFYKSIEPDTNNVYVMMIADEIVLIIKSFNSDDLEYNILCANELVELLNQEQ